MGPPPAGGGHTSQIDGGTQGALCVYLKLPDVVCAVTGFPISREISALKVISCVLSMMIHSTVPSIYYMYVYVAHGSDCSCSFWTRRLREIPFILIRAVFNPLFSLDII